MLMNILGFVLIALIIMVIIFAKMSIVIISQSETKVVERLGKYYATLRPGINIIIPFIDRTKEIVAMRLAGTLIPVQLTYASRCTTLIVRT